MTEQLAFDVPLRALARRRDPVTSKAAARRVNAVSISARVCESLRTYGPADTDQLAARLGLKLVTVSPRMRPLARKGGVVELEARDGKIVWDVPR